MTHLKKLSWLIFLVPFAVILVWHASTYYPFISDDALISLRYADRLIAGEGLTWSEGRPVEGYSNFLWVLAVALLGSLGMDLIVASRLLGVLGMLVIMSSILCWYARRGTDRAGWFSLAVSLLFLALCAPVAVWAIGGLEQPLYGALLAVLIPLTFSAMEADPTRESRVPWWLSLVLGLLCLTRPDGPIFTVLSVAFLFVPGIWTKNRRLILDSLRALSLPVLFYMGHLGFRLYYYGEWVPNTALVKLTPSATHFQNGFVYVVEGLKALFPFSFLALAAVVCLVFSKSNRLKGLYLSSILVSWSGYLVFIGGGYFPAHRHFIPLIVVFGFALVEGSQWAMRYLAALPSARTRNLAAVLGVLLFVPYGLIQFKHPENRRAVEERWEWKGRDLGLVLKAAFLEKQPLMAVTAAGCLPYWSGLPALDMLGLNDYYLPRNPPVDFGTGPLGHELGDGDYVLRREPDMIVFHTGKLPQYRSGRDLEATPRFHELYVAVLVATREDHVGIVFFHKYSAKVGILRSETEIRIPGFFFRGRTTISYLSGANRLAIPVGRGQQARAIFEAGSVEGWEVRVKSSGPGQVRSLVEQDGRRTAVTLYSESQEAIEVEEVILSPPTSPSPVG